jgi:hypothetical protein
MLVAAACSAQSTDAPPASTPVVTPIRSIGSVSPSDATVIDAAGNFAPVPANGSVQLLTGGDTVRALDHTAPVRLSRGGEVLVCEGTRVHLADSADASLLLGLDRGAMEVKTQAKAGDVVLTPDLRFTIGEAAPLDLQMRVTTAGDTCVDNRGHRAPTLEISDAFGESTYLLKPGQHVTFEHGGLREVVDKETVPCGCPVEELKRGSLADALLAGGSQGKPMTPAQKSAAEHPFPAAVSEGLVPPSPAPPQAPNVTHVTVAATLGYDPNAPAPPAGPPPAASVPQQQPPQPSPPKKRKGGPFRAVGRFFKGLFAR